MVSLQGRAIDISNYTGQLTAEQTTAMQAAAIRLVVVRLSLESTRNQIVIARQQIRTLQQAAIPWQGYFWAYYDTSPYEQIRHMHATYRDLYDGYYGNTLYLDDEDEETLGEDSYGWLLRAGRAARRWGFAPGIYTRPDLWNGQQRRPVPDELAPRFARWPLWSADWSANPDSPPPPFPPFTNLAMLQHTTLDFSLPAVGQYDRNRAYNVT